MTRLRRMSTILSTYEMSTGHCSSQARHVVQAQSTSGWIDVGRRGRRGLRSSRGASPLRRAVVRDAMISSSRAVEVVAQIEREVLRAEDLAGPVRRAVVRAAAALGARVEVEDRLPREVLDARDADAAAPAGPRPRPRRPPSPSASRRSRPSGAGGPAGARLRGKTFGIAVMTWKCFECGSRFRKTSTASSASRTRRARGR